MNKFTLSLITLLGSILISSCCKAIIEEHFFIHNQTNETIELLQYQNGSYTTLVLPLNTKQELDKRPPFGEVDSIVVVKAGRTIETHYSAQIAKATGIAYGNTKNIINQNNYQRELIQRLACDGSRSSLTYTFR